MWGHAHRAKGEALAGLPAGMRAAVERTMGDQGKKDNDYIFTSPLGR